jgi:outer membrane protein
MRHVLWLTLLLALPARAERLVTYQEALRASITANPSLQTARSSLEQAETSVFAARSSFDPAFQTTANWKLPVRNTMYFQTIPYTVESRQWDASSSLGGSLASGTSYSLAAGVGRDLGQIVTALVGPDERVQDLWRANVNATLSQEILKGHRFAYNVQNITQARSAMEVAELRVLQAEQQALADTATAYWGWVLQGELREIADDAVAVAEEGLRVGTLQVEAEQLPEVERIRLEAALMQARVDALDAENSDLAARDRLLILIGLPSGEDIAPATGIGDVKTVAVEAAKAVDTALAQNLGLVISRAQEELAELDAGLAKHARLPSLSANVNMGYLPNYDAESGSQTVVSGLTESATPGFSVGGVFSMPLGNRAARAEHARAGSVVAQRRRELGELALSVRSDVEANVRTLASSMTRVELADANVRLADASLAAEEAKVREGVTLHKDALEARQALASARGEAVRARGDYRLAQVELLRLQGLLTAELP